MITACWSEKREQRWDVHAVHDQLSTSSIQEVPEVEPDVQIAQASTATTVIPPKALPPVPSALQVEAPDPPVQQSAGTKPPKRGKKFRSLTTPVEDKPKRGIPKKHFTFPGLPRGSHGETGESKPDPSLQGKRTRKKATLSRGWSQLRTVVKVLTAFLRLRKPPATGGRP
jgi:hypothetical protein